VTENRQTTNLIGPNTIFLIRLYHRKGNGIFILARLQNGEEKCAAKDAMEKGERA
jgi:hypothetical protein